jgi:3-methyladenine DNA glycosylase AlkC
MAEPLKHSFGPDVPRRIAAQVSAVYAGFPAQAFLDDVLAGYDALELLPRGAAIAAALRRHLPASYPAALEILMASLGPRAERPAAEGMAAFFYLPHTRFVGDYGLDDFGVSMRALHELTQRFTAEFAIRPFLVQHTERTLRQLRAWATDPSAHVRRLASEGTRPRLPWAPRLRMFQHEPAPVLALLELLKDDPELYVRRSVANNLNDIGKDHPALLAATAARWLEGAGPDRTWLVRHALRALVKQGDPAALELMGAGEVAHVALESIELAPSAPVIGDAVKLRYVLRHHGTRRQRLLVDLRVHFVKADGGTRPKVFKLAVADAEPGEALQLAKTVSVRQHTTRTHYPGLHRLELLVNGSARPAGEFMLGDARRLAEGPGEERRSAAG